MAVKNLSNSSVLQPASVNSMLGDYESNYFHHLETVRISNNTASISFTNLGQYNDYQHLQLRVVLRSDLAQTYEEIKLTFNGDADYNYTDHYLACNGSSVFTGWDTNGNWQFTQPFSMAVGNSNASGIFGAGVIDLLDAFEATKRKTFRSFGGRLTADGEKRVTLASGLWFNTAAITSIQLAPKVGSNWISGSRISLYGLKARS